MDIKLLHKEGHSIRQIAKATGLSRNTIRNVLRKKVPLPFQIPQRPSKLDPLVIGKVLWLVCSPNAAAFL